MLLTHANDRFLLFSLVPEDAINVSLILLDTLLLESMCELDHVLGLYHAHIFLLRVLLEVLLSFEIGSVLPAEHFLFYFSLFLLAKDKIHLFQVFSLIDYNFNGNQSA